MDNSFEQNFLFSENLYITENDSENDLKSDPFALSFYYQSAQDDSSISENIYFNNKKQIIFEIYKDETQEKSALTKSQKKLSGRKRKNPSENKRKIHNKYDNDNILRKLNIYFLNFLIGFINEVLLKCNINDKFYDINGDFKKKINQNNLVDICKKTIAELLGEDNNKKYTNTKQNIELLKQIKNNNNNILNDILYKKIYIEIFIEVYYKNKKEITYEGLKLNLLKTFNDFLESADVKEDSLYKQKIEKVIKKDYFKAFNLIKSNTSTDN